MPIYEYECVKCGERYAYGFKRSEFECAKAYCRAKCLLQGEISEEMREQKGISRFPWPWFKNGLEGVAVDSECGVLPRSWKCNDCRTVEFMGPQPQCEVCGKDMTGFTWDELMGERCPSTS